MLETDPDLEAYLQVAINETLDEAELREAGGGSEGGGEFEEDEDLDLDKYLNELSADVEEVGEAEGGVEAEAEAKGGKDGT
jgi:hypothetical protein